MTTQEAEPRSKTAEAILDIAEMLIQTRGYNGFSYQDIARALGIRKASIHYHFPSKTDLGVAVIDRYATHFGARLAAIADDPSANSMALLDFYITPYQQFAETPDRVCLCAALAGEMMALPEVMRKRVDRFFKAHQRWLTGILERGRERGEFTLSVPPTKMARLIFAALQGALLVKRATGEAAQFRDVANGVRSQLAAAA